MASPFQVNINISAGVDFTQQFTVNNPDFTPVNITGFKFHAKLAKHPTAIDAMTSTSGSPVYNYVSFDTSVVDGEKGIYSIEKFLIARRLMYWQVYLHKTVVSAENMLIKVSKYLQDRFNHSTKITLNLLEPAVIIFMGGFVSLIVLAILLPLIQLNTFSL